MKTITVSSGKGGVGKSSITAIIALYLAKKQNKQIVYADCDVDAPNAHILLNLKEKDFYEREEIFASEKATLIAEKCIHCRKCVSADICNFNAISWNKEKNIPEFNKYLCEGCGSCSLICPVNPRNRLCNSGHRTDSCSIARPFKIDYSCQIFSGKNRHNH